MHNKFKRTAVILAAAAGATAVLAFIGLHVATRALKSQVEQALGPDSEVAQIVVGFSAIEARGVRIRAPKGWPATDALRAERIVIRPDLRGLSSARVRIASITVEQPYLSVLRARNGRVRLLPSLLENRPKKTGDDASGPVVVIGSIELVDGTLEFFDATVRQPAHKLRLEQVQATVSDLQVPGTPGRTGLRLNGAVKGVQRNGSFAVNGWAELADRNSSLATRLQGVDLIALQPYLIKASETGVRRGTLDLDLKSTVRRNQLHAPGRLTLAGLELSSTDSAFSTFMGVPRQLVVAALKDRDDRIDIDFTLEGNLNDPKFSVNESFTLRLAASLAESLGLSIEGLARGVGGAAEGLGGMVKKLFGQ